MLTFFVLSIAICLQTIDPANAGCTISTLQDINDPQALILRPEGGDGNDAFFMPDVGGVIININEGQTIHLNCGGRNFRLHGVNVGGQSANATCLSGNLFNVLGNNVHFTSVNCSLFPLHTARFTGNICLGEHLEFEIGFDVNNRFIRLMRGCFDVPFQRTLFVVSEVTPNIEGFQVGFPRPSWLQGNFFDLNGIPLNTLYTRNTQRITINNLLGLEVNSTKYVHETNNFFLARGHLAARADFIFGIQMRATFYFINAAPHWQTFNQANWATMEGNVRRYVIDRGVRVLIYTGTYGVSTLPHAVTGEEVELFLFVDENNNRAIPVPLLFWKVVYEPVSKLGIAFLGVNNPYLANATQYVICPNICNQIDWLTWTPTNITRGYSYCCSVDAFREATGLLPDFEVTELLR